MTEVVPAVNEDDGQFVERANEKLSRIYPNSNKQERARMARKILDVERQRMDSEFGERQLAHERSADEVYRAKLEELRSEYRTAIGHIRGLKTLLSDDIKQQTRERAREDLLTARKKAFEEYDESYHQLVDAKEPTSEDIEAFRRQELKELNEQHERIVNYEAKRLGVDRALDSGVISRFMEGDFNKEASSEDLRRSLERGFNEDYESPEMLEVRRFVGNLWQPELENIKHNAIRRMVASPVRSRNVVREGGGSYDESRFVLPIDNQEFTEYVAESMSDDNGVLVLGSGLSETLRYGTKDEALTRARWFCDIAAKKGLSADKFLDIVEAQGIASGVVGDEKWNDRFYDLSMGFRFDEKEEADEQLEGRRVEEDAEKMLRELRGELRDLVDNYKDYQMISNDIASPNTSRGTGERGDANIQLDEVSEMARQIVLVFRQIQHKKGTQEVINELSGVDDELEIGEPVNYIGQWASNNKCVVSIFKISLGGDKESWAFISEGIGREQDIYYGLRGSEEAVKKLFNGTYYRRSGMQPNINDESGVECVRHSTSKAEELRKKIAGAWDEGESPKEVLADRSSYDTIKNWFFERIVDFVDESDDAEELETIEQLEQQRDRDAVIVDVERDDKEDVQPATEVVPEMKPGQLFKRILADGSPISKRGRDAIKGKNKSLGELARTPKKNIVEFLDEADIEKLTNILDDNGIDHPAWN